MPCEFITSGQWFTQGVCGFILNSLSSNHSVTCATCFVQILSVRDWMWPSLLDVHRFCAAIEGKLSHFLPRWPTLTEGRLSHFLPRWLRGDWAIFCHIGSEWVGRRAQSNIGKFLEMLHGGVLNSVHRENGQWDAFSQWAIMTNLHVVNPSTYMR